MRMAARLGQIDLQALHDGIAFIRQHPQPLRQFPQRPPLFAQLGTDQHRVQTRQPHLLRNLPDRRLVPQDQVQPPAQRIGPLAHPHQMPPHPRQTGLQPLGIARRPPGPVTARLREIELTRRLHRLRGPRAHLVQRGDGNADLGIRLVPRRDGQRAGQIDQHRLQRRIHRRGRGLHHLFHPLQPLARGIARLQRGHQTGHLGKDRLHPRRQFGAHARHLGPAVLHPLRDGGEAAQRGQHPLQQFLPQVLQRGFHRAHVLPDAAHGILHLLQDRLGLRRHARQPFDERIHLRARRHQPVALNAGIDRHVRDRPHHAVQLSHLHPHPAHGRAQGIAVAGEAVEIGADHLHVAEGLGDQPRQFRPGLVSQRVIQPGELPLGRAQRVDPGGQTVPRRDKAFLRDPQHAGQRSFSGHAHGHPACTPVLWRRAKPMIAAAIFSSASDCIALPIRTASRGMP